MDRNGKRSNGGGRPKNGVPPRKKGHTATAQLTPEQIRDLIEARGDANHEAAKTLQYWSTFIEERGLTGLTPRKALEQWKKIKNTRSINAVQPLPQAPSQQNGVLAHVLTALQQAVSALQQSEAPPQAVVAPVVVPPGQSGTTQLPTGVIPQFVPTPPQAVVVAPPQAVVVAPPQAVVVAPPQAGSALHPGNLKQWVVDSLNRFSLMEPKAIQHELQQMPRGELVLYTTFITVCMINKKKKESISK